MGLTPVRLDGGSARARPRRSQPCLPPSTRSCQRRLRANASTPEDGLTPQRRRPPLTRPSRRHGLHAASIPSPIEPITSTEISTTPTLHAVCDFSEIYRKVDHAEAYVLDRGRPPGEDPRDHRARRRPDPDARRASSRASARLVRRPPPRYQSPLPIGEHSRV